MTESINDIETATTHIRDEEYMRFKYFRVAHATGIVPIVIQ